MVSGAVRERHLCVSLSGSLSKHLVPLPAQRLIGKYPVEAFDGVGRSRVGHHQGQVLAGARIGQMSVPQQVHRARGGPPQPPAAEDALTAAL